MKSKSNTHLDKGYKHTITQILLTAGIAWSFAGAPFTKETSDDLDSYSPLGKFILLFLGGPAVWFLTVSLLPWIAFTFYKQRRYRKQIRSDLEQLRAFVEKTSNTNLSPPNSRTFLK